MPIPKSERELIALFRELGAPYPEQWAGSQVREEIPQLLRFLFLKNAWRCVTEEGDSKWIDREVQDARQDPVAPYAGLGLALSRCKDRGVSDEDLTEIARGLQAQMLFNIAYLLDDPGELPKSLEDVCWGLFQVDEDGRPIGRQVSGLHESVLELDPTGREMRPRQ